MARRQRALVADLRGEREGGQYVLAGSRGTWSSAERFRGVRTSGTDRRKKDFANGTLAPQLGSGTAGRLGHRGIASSGRLLDRESAVRCPESQRERE